MEILVATVVVTLFIIENLIPITTEFINLWRSFISCQTIHIKRYLIGEQALV
jgi:hypothetical protein